MIFLFLELVLAQCLWGAFSMHTVRLLHADPYLLPPVTWDRALQPCGLPAWPRPGSVCTQGCVAELLFSFLVLVDGAPGHYSAQMGGILFLLLFFSQNKSLLCIPGASSPLFTEI